MNSAHNLICIRYRIPDELTFRHKSSSYHEIASQYHLTSVLSPLIYNLLQGSVGHVEYDSSLYVAQSPLNNFVTFVVSDF